MQPTALTVKQGELLLKLGRLLATYVFQANPFPPLVEYNVMIVLWENIHPVMVLAFVWIVLWGRTSPTQGAHSARPAQRSIRLGLPLVLQDVS